MGYIARVNRTRVTPEHLIEANLAIAEMVPEDRRDMTARAVRIIRLLEEKNMKGRNRPDMLTAITFRLEALARLELQKHREMGAWSRPGDETGQVFAHEDLFKAAALEPLISESERPAFEPVSFFQRLLSISKEQGHG